MKKSSRVMYMRIAIPTDGNKGLEDDLAEHFGRCNTYTFIDEKGMLIEVIKNTSEHMGGTGLPPELLKKKRADILLCRELGPRAIGLFDQLGIGVYVCQAKTVKEAFIIWKSKKAKRAGLEDVCREHSL